MPWVSIIVFLVSFLLAKRNGASTGKAAAIGAGAGLATYYLADPANPDNLLEIGSGSKAEGGSTLVDNGSEPPSNGGGAGVGGVLSSGIQTAGGVLKSWGPAGTLGVVAGGTALASIDKKWLFWGALALGAVLLLK